MDNIAHHTHSHDSSSSDSGYEKPSSFHRVLGSGKLADVFLWRDKKVSAGVLGGATAIWLLFDVLEHHPLSLVSHGLILGLTILFLWSNATTFINKFPPRFVEVSIPEEAVLKFASALRIKLNRAFSVLRDIALGRDLKKFLSVIVGLWVLSDVGNLCDFLTLLYTITVLLFTVPIAYKKYEDRVDSFAEKVAAELKKQYAVFDDKVLSKLPRGPLKDEKRE